LPTAARRRVWCFDEIDTGARRGGRRHRRAAGAPRRTRAGARRHPCAPGRSRADHHYLITKDTLAKGKRLATRIAELAPDLRREEIARMLAGAEITAEARAAAERLMQPVAG
jgi:DNA repair protein RecN (Recombination protein N)